MISYAEALSILQREVTPLQALRCATSDLPRGAAASDVQSPLAVPQFANAAMDGFALAAEATRSAGSEQPIEFEVIASIAAGDPPLASAETGGTFEIMTGAPLPPACDAVIPVERVDVENRDGKTYIRVTQSVEAGRNVRQPGEDYQQGQVVLGQGEPLEPQTAMALAAIGIDAIALRPPPRVALITTGAELSGSASAPGMIRDANGPYLKAVMHRIGADTVSAARTSDHADDIERAIADGAEQADIVITTGGVSAGRYDLLPEIATTLGADILFHKIRVRPGKPVMVARLPNDSLLLALPGNPIAAAVCLRFVGIPVMRQMQGLAPETYPNAVAAKRITKRSEFVFFGKARARVRDDARVVCELLPGQESFRIAPLAAANAWAIVAEGTSTIKAGDLIQAAPLYPDGFLS